MPRYKYEPPFVCHLPGDRAYKFESRSIREAIIAAKDKSLETEIRVKTTCRVEPYLYTVTVSIPVKACKGKTVSEILEMVDQAIDAECRRIAADREKHKGWEGSFDHYKHSSPRIQ